MKGQVSRATRRVYPLTMICAVYRVARSSVYAVTPPAAPPTPASKPGPKTRHSDAEVVEAIRAVLAACPFHGEGYRKVRARRGLRRCGAVGNPNEEQRGRGPLSPGPRTPSSSSAIE